MTSKSEINEALAVKVLDVVDAGLSEGVGEPIPGQMCIEAAVNYAMGNPHGDDLSCVNYAVRSLKITLNDMENVWDDQYSGTQDRAKSLRRLAIAQLGSYGVIKTKPFQQAINDLVWSYYTSWHQEKIDKINSIVVDLKDKASISDLAFLSEQLEADTNLEFDINSALCDNNVEKLFCYTVDAELHPSKGMVGFMNDFCEEVVGILKKMKSPGCKYLYLTESKKNLSLARKKVKK